MKKRILLFILCIITFSLTGCSKPQTIGLGDSFEYNGFKVTIGNHYTLDKFIDDKEVIVPIAFENTTNGTRELGITFTVFGPNGGEVSKFSVDSSTKVKPGGKYNDEISIIAEEGSGEYQIEVDNSNITIVVDARF